MTTLVSIAAACLAIGAGTDHILVRDLVPAFPSAEASDERPVALAPAPGVQRIFHAAELRRLATRLGIPGEPQRDLCFERRRLPLNPTLLLQAMHQQLPAAEIEILDYARLPVPDGELEFPIAGLRQTAGAGLWSGSVRYAGGRQYRIWAKIRITSATARVIATEDLKAGQTLDASQLRVEIENGSPMDAAFLTTAEQAQGRTLARPVTAGTALRSQWLVAARDVSRGEIVEVDVWNGGTHLRLPAVAEASGSKGQVIPVRNPESKKRFWGQVTGKSRVSVGKEGL